MNLQVLFNVVISLYLFSEGCFGLWMVNRNRVPNVLRAPVGYLLALTLIVAGVWNFWNSGIDFSAYLR